mmetsp:Transcript_6256/g.16195  ORF Transcript_6256/g.16195 Transcript_6256/m.16195 type:complete len:145 (-) Transcript_6256:18-452(-)
MARFLSTTTLLSLLLSALFTTPTINAQSIVAEKKSVGGPRKLLFGPFGTLKVSRDDCLSAAIAAYGSKVTATRPLQEGNWDWVPAGCSVQSGGDWAAHYNHNKEMEPAGPKRARDRAIYTLVESSASSPPVVLDLSIPSFETIG